MSQSEPVFSAQHVQKVSEEMRSVSQTYEALFTDLGEQILRDIDQLDQHSEQVETTLSHIELALHAFSEYFPSNDTVACRKGCGHCCVFPVKTPPQFISFIAEHLKLTRSNKDMSELIVKMKQNIEERKPPLHRAQCPLLDDNHACSIYEHRPLACRLFTSPDVQLCLKSVTDGSSVSQQPIRYRVYQSATVALQAQLKKQNKPYEQIDFIPALLAELT